MQTVPAQWPQYPYYQGCLSAQARVGLPTTEWLCLFELCRVCGPGRDRSKSVTPVVSVPQPMSQPVVYAPPQYVSYAVQDAAYLRTVRGDGKPADPKVISCRWATLPSREAVETRIHKLLCILV